ncbi:MAG: Na/Pi symporter [Acidobacteriota bacterium]
MLFLFLVGIRGLGVGFKLLGKDLLQAFFSSTENPFVGVVVGILATTLVQSSSVTTSMIVGLCAAPDNPLPIANAVPMVMGANIGTTVTNTLVSLAHMGRRTEFLRAFSTATCHDFFNFIAVAVLLPVELLTGAISRPAAAIARLLLGFEGVEYHSPLKAALKAAFSPVESVVDNLTTAHLIQAGLILAVSAILIVTALLTIVRLMRTLMHTRLESSLRRVVGRNALISMALGVVITVMVQSSSITTSLLVPLAGAGLIKLRQAFPITLGANIGTTVTALLASLAVTGGHAVQGIEIGLVHLIFNMVGIALIYPYPPVRRLALRAAMSLAKTAVRSRGWAIAYVLGLFYAVPAACIVISRLFR